MVSTDTQNELNLYLFPMALFEEVIILDFLCSTLHHKHHSVIAQCTCNFDCISWVCSCTEVAAFVFEMQISLFLVHILLFSILIRFSTVWMWDNSVKRFTVDLQIGTISKLGWQNFCSDNTSNFYRVASAVGIIDQLSITLKICLCTMYIENFLDYQSQLY